MYSGIYVFTTLCWHEIVCLWGQGPHLIHIRCLKALATSGAEQALETTLLSEGWDGLAAPRAPGLHTLIRRSVHTWRRGHLVRGTLTGLAQAFLSRGLKGWFCHKLAVQLRASRLTSPGLSLFRECGGALRPVTFKIRPRLWKPFVNEKVPIALQGD